MSFWTRFPAFRVVVLFASGIFISSRISIGYWFWIATLFMSLAFLLFLIRSDFLKSHYSLRWVAGVPLFSSIFLTGILLYQFNQEHHYNGRFPESKKHSNYIIKVLEDPIETKSGVKCKAEVVGFNENQNWRSCRGKVLVYFKIKSPISKIHFGDYLFIKCRFTAIEISRNPVSFNYPVFLQLQGIYHQTFVDSSSYRIIQSGRQPGLLQFANNLRNLLLTRLSDKLKSDSQKGVAGALLLGYDGWLDQDQENEFARVGVLHVLCVSGMHVGLIYMICLWLVAWMKSFRNLKHLRTIFILIVIWLYALVTGLAPSVMRAASMLSFVILAVSLNRNGNVYNLLCVTCLFLLGLNPNLLFAAGFQLSFLAVCGIVFFHPLIFSLLKPKWGLLKRMWELLSISISAQITTFPLSVYLFHQFPNYFLLGNLLILPLIGLIMYCGLAVLVIGAVPVVGNLAGMATAFLIDVLNKIVSFISNIPGAISTNIHLSVYEVILLYIIIILFPVWVHLKLRFFPIIILILICLISSVRTLTIFNATNRNELVVYHHNKSDLVIQYKNRSALIISDTLVSEELLKYTASDDIRSKFTADTICYMINNNEIIWLNEYNTMIITEWNYDKRLPASYSELVIKNLILGKNVKMNSDSLIMQLHPEQIIVGSSLNYFESKKINEIATVNNIPIYNILEQGYFRTKLNPRW